MNLLDFIFPKRCVGCGRVGNYICLRCRKKIIPIAPNECMCPVCEKLAIAGITHPKCRNRYTPDGLTSFFYYKDIVRSAIHEIKYRYVSDLASEFINCIPLQRYEIWSLHGNTTAVVMPIPLHPARFTQRGFNQSEILGKYVAEALQLPMVTNVLKRIAETLPQAQQKNRNERISNLHHAFGVSSHLSRMSHIKTIILFDDVFTSGATMREASNVLKRHGVTTVWCVTMAR